ncbi:MAG: hypothetical protein JNK32_07760 [Anaerolineales bacterium]|nr:hypothetical protein [Anaerolineales bacterium]
MNAKRRIHVLFAVLIFFIYACGASTTSQPTELPATAPAGETATNVPPIVITATHAPASTATALPTEIKVIHFFTPAPDAPVGRIVYDPDSSGTGIADKRAPYGDSFDLNFLERPFLQDMTYAPDLDIVLFGLGQDTDFYYASIKMIGNDPNHSMGIQFGVEIDSDKDGFGNFVVLAQPPFAAEWTTENVQAFADENHNTSGASPLRSDPHFLADGYETLIFDGANNFGGDPDLGWARLSPTEEATIQIAFKRNLAGDEFMVSVLADAGLKDVKQLDYVDRFSEKEAGSPIKGVREYPLQSLFAVDNTCRMPVGFQPTGFEPMVCSSTVPPTPKSTGNNQPGSPGEGCSVQPTDCDETAPYFWPFPHCACSTEPYP